ncbi:PEP-CTERM sorting domain-containing protein [Pseudoduganella albidiflava]|nr:PEP-CTERM sorting domain-containing protein [Pseudoduganella albidiflava]GGY31565.1 hypothetical protein GCM10007387_12040 [Pseudoduganella albidiflava]
MRSLPAVCSLLIAIAATPASAYEVTVEYKVKVNKLLVYGTGYVQHSDLLGFDLSVGDVVTGYFIYDTTTPLIRDGHDMWMLYENFQQSVVFENAPGPIDLSYHAGLRAWELDVLDINTHGSSGPDGQATLATSFVDEGPYRPLNFYLPAENQWSNFSPSLSSFNYYHQGELEVVGNMTSFRVVPVPEPGTYMMLAVGGMVLLAARRKRRPS